MIIVSGLMISCIRYVQDDGLKSDDRRKLAIMQVYGYLDVYLMNCSSELILRSIIFIILISCVMKYSRAKELQSELKDHNSELLQKQCTIWLVLLAASMLILNILVDLIAIIIFLSTEYEPTSFTIFFVFDTIYLVVSCLVVSIIVWTHDISYKMELNDNQSLSHEDYEQSSFVFFENEVVSDENSYRAGGYRSSTTHSPTAQSVSSKQISPASSAHSINNNHMRSASDRIINSQEAQYARAGNDSFRTGKS